MLREGYVDALHGFSDTCSPLALANTSPYSAPTRQGPYYHKYFIKFNLTFFDSSFASTNWASIKILSHNFTHLRDQYGLWTLRGKLGDGPPLFYQNLDLFIWFWGSDSSVHRIAQLIISTQYTVHSSRCEHETWDILSLRTSNFNAFPKERNDAKEEYNRLHREVYNRQKHFQYL